MSVPILLPPEPAPQRRLPPLVAWLGLLGLVVLGLGTVPATLERQRLDQTHARLAQAIARQEAELERWDRMRLDAGRPSFLRERTLRELLRPKARDPKRGSAVVPSPGP
jgi:hypothetical protein